MDFNKARRLSETHRMIPLFLIQRYLTVAIFIVKNGILCITGIVNWASLNSCFSLKFTCWFLYIFFLLCVTRDYFSFELFDFVKLTPTSCYCMNFIELHCCVSHCTAQHWIQLKCITLFLFFFNWCFGFWTHTIHSCWKWGY